jgi:hypothetical protein
MLKAATLAVCSWLLLVNVAEASPIRPELDATLCYMRMPGLIDLSYTLCGANRLGTVPSPSQSVTAFPRPPLFTPTPVSNNPFIYQGPVGPGATWIPPLGQTRTPSEGGPCQYASDYDRAGNRCGERSAERRRGGR